MKAAVPVGEEHELAVLRRLDSVAVVGVRIATLAGGERAADVLDAPVGDLEGVRRIGDVDQPEVAVPVRVAVAARRLVVGIATRRHGRVRKGPAEVGAVLHLELVHAARAATRVQ
jgi:hypothetical protein